MGHRRPAVRRRDCDGRVAESVPEADGAGVTRIVQHNEARQPFVAATGTRGTLGTFGTRGTLVMLTLLRRHHPDVCVRLTALVTLLAESFRSKNERMPFGFLPIIGLVGRRDRLRPPAGSPEPPRLRETSW